MYKIGKEQLSSLFAAIAEQMDLYMPLNKHGQVNYGIWSEEEEPALDALNTVKSPKDFFFPQSENLYTCYREGKKISITPEELRDKPFAVFGIRGCDVKSIEVLDKVFLADPVDSFYQARREHGVLISSACHEPEETCFCGVFGVNAQAPEGDVVTWTVGETLYWEPKTEKGEVLTRALCGQAAPAGQDAAAEGQSTPYQAASALLTPAGQDGQAAVEQEQQKIKAILQKLPYRDLDLEPFKNAELLDLFNSPKWNDLYKACLGCGTCTFVCPTCQCYDIRDYDSASGIKRFRCWDSCMYSDFTLMAHGNIRNTQMERFRQRFMHKLVYFPDNNDGMFSCVGCGRCVGKCPSSLNIVKVIKSLGVSEDV